jgi:hypothetical protein
MLENSILTLLTFSSSSFSFLSPHSPHSLLISLLLTLLLFNSIHCGLLQLIAPTTPCAKCAKGSLLFSECDPSPASTPFSRAFVPSLIVSIGHASRNMANVYKVFDAAFKGDLPRVQKMLADGDAIISDAAPSGRTALLYAASGGSRSFRH